MIEEQSRHLQEVHLGGGGRAVSTMSGSRRDFIFLNGKELKILHMNMKGNIEFAKKSSFGCFLDITEKPK